MRRKKQQHLNEIKSIIIFAVALLTLASLISYTPNDVSFLVSSPNITAKNLIGTPGAWLAAVLFSTIGWTSYLVVILLVFWGWNKLLNKELVLRFSKFLSMLVLVSVISSLISMVIKQGTSLGFQSGGIAGDISSDFLIKYFGRAGSYIILITLGMLSFSLISEFLISPFVFGFGSRLISLGNFLRGLFVGFIRNIEIRRRTRVLTVKARPKVIPQPSKDIPLKKITTGETKPKPKIGIEALEPTIKEQEIPKRVKSATVSEKITGDYKLPSLDLLDDPPPFSSRQIKDDLMANAKVLEETLADFGVSVHTADIERGPVITRYELEPAPGVKVQKISALSDDIALAMKAQSIRIVAPIPGKGRVGVEVPNSQSSLVYIKEMLNQDEFRNSKSKLTLTLGKDIAGEPVIADLSDMPHLLIAGTTGSGKTVCVNSIIMSMLFSATPQEIRFLMVDPKMVELAPFNGLPHLLCPVITDAKRASSAFNWVVNEMQTRYELLAKSTVRNIEAYNQKYEKMPYIVVVVDELADLMVVAANQIENAITRLAQLSRAVGIHLILATQRPSVDVVTGVIKANFPARISFKVASKVDSRTVLDMNGADKLLGKGDMLFLQPGDAKPTRAQGTLIQDREIEKVVEFIRSQQETEYVEEIMMAKQKGGVRADSEKDELFDEAVRLILESNHASVSILQRRMRLGYTRAARLIDAMEQEGIIGAFRGSKPREILVDKEAWLGKKENE